MLFVLGTALALPAWALDAPVLTSLPATTTTNPETITGTATVGVEVRLFVNGELMELATPQPDGSFSIKIPLFDGSNVVHAIAWDGLEESVVSNTLSTTYTNTLPRVQGGTIASDTVWTPAGGAYQLTSNLTVAANVEFRVMPGVEIRVDSAKVIDVNGVLIANGSATAPIAFRSSLASPTRTSWIGIRVNATGYVDFDRARIEHATRAMQFVGGEGTVKRSTLTANATGVDVLANSSPSFTEGFDISDNNYGVTVTGNSIEAQNPAPVFTGGTIRGSYYSNYQTQSFGNGGAVTLNATHNWWGTTDVAAIAGKIIDNSDQIALPTVDFSSYLGSAGGAPAHAGGFLVGPINSNRTIAAGDYQMLGQLRIAAGVTLTMEPGTTVRVPDSTSGAFVIDVNGTLVAHGTSTQPIQFKSSLASPTKNSWTGLRINDTGYLDADYVVVEHASNGMHFNGGEGVVKHTTLRSNTTGVRVQANSSPSFTEGFEISDNNYGVIVTGNNIEAQNPAPVFSGGTIRNSYYNNYQTETFGNGGAVMLNATSNWWGTLDVATIASKIVDNSDQVALPTVNFSSYLASAGGVPAHTGGFLVGPINSNRTIAAGDYQMLSHVRIASGVTVTVEPGTTIRAPDGLYGKFVIEVSGTLVAHGTSAQPIAFRSALATPTKNSWTGLRISNTGYIDAEYVVVEHATYAMQFSGGEGVVKRATLRSNTVGVSVLANSSPSFTEGFEISDNTEGVVVTGNNIEAQNPAPVFSGGTIRNSYNSNYKTESFGNGGAVVLNATNNWWGTTDAAIIASKVADNSDQIALPTVDFSGYLGSVGGAPAHTGGFLVGPINSNRTIAAGDYQMLSHVRIAAGVTVTVEPGTTIRVPDGLYGKFVIDVNGTLIAHGTVMAPIVFRSALASATKNHWTGIRVGSAGYVDFDYVLVEHATNAMEFVGGEGVVKHTTLRSSGIGVSVLANSSPSFTEGFDISDNNYGVVVVGNTVEAQNPGPVFTGGAIRNSYYSSYKTESFGNGGAVVLNATGNWWGVTDPTIIHNKIVDRRDVASLPEVDFLEFKESLGGPSHLIVFDVTFTRRDADSIGGVTARLDYTVNTSATVHHDIVSEDTGSAIRTDSISRGPGRYTLEWDGTDNAGDAVAKGVYRYVPRLTDATRSWTDDPAAPATFMDSAGVIPARFNAFRNEFFKLPRTTYGLSAGKAVMITPPSGTPFYPVLNHISPAGTEWFYWDGRGPDGQIITGTIEMFFFAPIPPRPYYLRVIRSQPQITGILPAPAIEVKSDPYLITHSYEQLSRMAFRVDVDAYVTVKLLPPGIVDPSSSQAIVVMPEQLLSAVDGQGAPVDHQVEWRGHETSDPNRMRTTEEGAYTFTIQARSPITHRTTLYRGVLQIYQ